MKVKLSTILITAGIIIWLSIAFFIYTSRYSSAVQHFSFNSTKNYEDYNELHFRSVNAKLTLILLKEDMVFGYYGDSINNGKIVSIDEIKKLIDDAWKIFSKDFPEIFIKPIGEQNYNTTGRVLRTVSANQVSNYTMMTPNKDEIEFLKLTNRITGRRSE